MKPVRQLDPKGCGIAAVATVIGWSYGHTQHLAVAGGWWRPTYGINGRMLKALLGAVDRPVLRVTRSARPTGVAIVNVHGIGHRFRHWVVVTDGVVFNTDGKTFPDLPTYLAIVKAASGYWYWVTWVQSKDA